MVFDPKDTDFLNIDEMENSTNQLLNYLQHQPPEVLTRVAQSVGPEIKQIISQNIQGLIGVLPSDQFNVQVTTDRENLSGLLASAMMTGYFLRRMEQRMELEDRLQDSMSLNQNQAGQSGD